MIELMISPPAALEALLFAAGEPLPKKQLTELLGISADQLSTALEALGRSLAGHGLALVESESDIELRTAPEAAGLVQKLREDELARDLGKGSLETLAVIAYQDGATRGEIDWVRGVNSSASVRTLLTRGLIAGKEDERDKRRMRYSLTTEALAHLGVGRAADLPRFAELRSAAQEIARSEGDDAQGPEAATPAP